MIKRFGCGFGLALRPEFGQAIGAELIAFGIERFVEAVGREQDRVSRRELNEVLFIGGAGKQAGRESTFAERLADRGAGVKREWKSCVGKGQGARGRIEDGIDRRAEAVRQRPLQKALIQDGEDRARVHAGLVNAAERAHHEGAVHGGGESFANDVADVEADESIGQMKEVEEVSAHVEKGVKRKAISTE